MGSGGSRSRVNYVSEERGNDELGNTRIHQKTETREEELRTAVTNSVNDPLNLRAVLQSSNAAAFSWSLKQHNHHSTAAMVKITWFRPFPSLTDAENKN